MEKELIKQEETAAPSTLDLLLGKGVVAVNKQLPTARYEVSRLSEEAGAPVVFTLRALPYGRVQELRRIEQESDIQILLAGCTDPDLRAPALQEFQSTPPARGATTEPGPMPTARSNFNPRPPRGGDADP